MPKTQNISMMRLLHNENIINVYIVNLVNSFIGPKNDFATTLEP